MYSDINSFHITVDTALTTANTRLYGFVAVGGVALSSVAFKDGDISGTALVTVDIPAGTGTVVQFQIPGAGVRFKSGLYADITGSPTGITVFTEGAKA